MANDIINLIYIVEKLLDENKAIYVHLDQRDMQQKHFAESVELNKAEELQDYRFQVQSL